ncbi:helix-turn-helix domain-containing protein [Rathayibacter sp. CAU 1779]
MRQRRLEADFLPAQVVVEEPAIWAHRGPAPQMERSHRHDDLELNYVVDGRLKYLFGGERMLVPSGSIAMFWASTPHRLIEHEDPVDSSNYWVHIPLARVFSWALPAEHLRQLLTSQAIVLPVEAIGREVESMFESWLDDLTGGPMEQCALLEVQALVQRLLFRHLEQRDDAHARARSAHSHNDGMQHIIEMAQFTVANFRSDISPTDIAQATHLNPNYAMTLFREVVGTTLGGYLTRCRMAEAQRLLLTTTMTTSEVAHAAGFGSQSSFYAHFTRSCNVSPSAYRNGARGDRELLEEHRPARASMCLP